MSRYLIRIVGGILVGVVAISVKFCMGKERREDASKQVLVQAQQMVREVPGYDKDPNYMEWLVKEGHTQVFTEAYHIDIGSRYQAGHDTMDLGKYEEDLFRWMIDRAKTDGRTTVADSLTKYHDNPEVATEEAEAPKQKENPFKKK